MFTAAGKGRAHFRLYHDVVVACDVVKKEKWRHRSAILPKMARSFKFSPDRPPFEAGSKRTTNAHGRRWHRRCLHFPIGRGYLLHRYSHEANYRSLLAAGKRINRRDFRGLRRDYVAPLSTQFRSWTINFDYRPVSSSRAAGKCDCSSLSSAAIIRGRRLGSDKTNNGRRRPMSAPAIFMPRRHRRHYQLFTKCGNFLPARHATPRK